MNKPVNSNRKTVYFASALVAVMCACRPVVRFASGLLLLVSGVYLAVDATFGVFAPSLRGTALYVLAHILAQLVLAILLLNRTVVIFY